MRFFVLFFIGGFFFLYQPANYVFVFSASQFPLEFPLKCVFPFKFPLNIYFFNKNFPKSWILCAHAQKRFCVNLKTVHNTQTAFSNHCAVLQNRTKTIETKLAPICAKRVGNATLSVVHITTGFGRCSVTISNLSKVRTTVFLFVHSFVFTMCIVHNTK